VPISFSQSETFNTSQGKNMKLGFVGLGHIGRPMADAILAAGHEVTVFDVFPGAMTPFAGRANLAASPADLGRRADLVGVCVRDDKDVEDVLTGSKGLLASLPERSVVAIHSTVRPFTVISMAKIAAQRSISVFDAAVSRSGGPKAFQVTCMVGGDREVIEKARPLIDAYSSKVIHAGALGTGMSLKVSNNLVTYLQLLAAVEGYRLAKACGLDIALLTDLMQSNGNMTPSMAAYMQGRTTGPTAFGTDAFVKAQTALEILAKKDLDLALESAKECGVALPTTQAARQLFHQVILSE
jgi:3-hydroxyisobutyrate dehydrogenase-like beta-hydroxyacid dehydrogenase